MEEIEINPKPLPTLDQIIDWLRRDVIWLDGLAEGLQCVPLKNKLNGVRANLKTLEKLLTPTE